MDKQICRSPDLTYILDNLKGFINRVFSYAPAPVHSTFIAAFQQPGLSDSRATKFSLAFYQLDYSAYLSHVFPRLCGQEMIIRSCRLGTIRRGTIIRDSKIASFFSRCRILRAVVPQSGLVTIRHSRADITRDFLYCLGISRDCIPLVTRQSRKEECKVFLTGRSPFLEEAAFGMSRTSTQYRSTASVSYAKAQLIIRLR